MRIISKLLVLGFIIGTYSDLVSAKILSYNKIELSLTAISDVNNWQDKQQDKSLWNYDQQIRIWKNFKTLSIATLGNIEYGLFDNVKLELKINPIQKIIEDDIPNPLIAIKTLSHIKKDDYIVYYQIGITGQNHYKFDNDSSLTYHESLSLSYCNTNIGNDTLGVLGEIDATYEKNNLAVNIEKMNLFLGRHNRFNIELPITIKYTKNRQFIAYNLLIRGSEKQIGSLSSIRIGYKLLP